MNRTLLQVKIIQLEKEFKDTPITYANKYLWLDKLNCLKEEILNEYKGKLWCDDSLDLLDNIKYMNNGMRDEVILFVKI